MHPPKTTNDQQEMNTAQRVLLHLTPNFSMIDNYTSYNKRDF